MIDERKHATLRRRPSRSDRPHRLSWRDRQQGHWEGLPPRVRVPVERDLALYDRGWQFERYDLLVLAIHGLEATRRAIGKLPLSTVEPTSEHGQVWRIPKSERERPADGRWRGSPETERPLRSTYVGLRLALLDGRPRVRVERAADAKKDQSANRGHEPSLE